MANMLSYLETYGERTFSELPFTPVDNLILSQLSYCGFEAAPLPCPMRSLNGKVTYGVLAEDNEKLFRLAAESRRFAETIPLLYVNEVDDGLIKQFSAVTFLLTDGSAYAAFRGTDSTLVGWREDFMLSFDCPVPAQRRAVKYLDEVSRVLHCPIRVGGHSKGGNLAMFAAAFCGEKTRGALTEVYCNDSPGFDKEILESEGFRRILPICRRYVPETSIIGMLLENDAAYTVIESDAVGFAQHNPYTWKTRGDGFVTKEELSAAGGFVNECVRGWLDRMDTRERRCLTDTLFDVLEAGGTRTLSQLRTEPAAKIKMLAALAKLNASERQKMLELIKALISSTAESGEKLVKEKLEDAGETAENLIKRLLPGDNNKNDG